MLVSQILRTKGDTVFTIVPGETVGAVAELLAAKRVGAFVVLEADKVVGIVSERDIVRAIAKEGAAALKRPAMPLSGISALRIQPFGTVRP